MKHKNKTKGQVMVLDVLFTVVLIILLFLFLFRWVEMKTYESTSERKQAELNYVGQNAFFSLTNNYNINCYAIDNVNQFLITSCFGSDSAITRENIGVPADYNCSFVVNGFNFTNSSGCSNTFNPASTNNYFMLKFNVITTSNLRIMNKTVYLNNIMDRNSNLVQREATLVIWK